MSSSPSPTSPFFGRSTLRTSHDLAAAGLVAAADAAPLDDVARRYSIAVSPHIADAIDRADPEDPIARQFVPHLDELIVSPDELADPIGDAPHSPVHGLVHRYPDRVLLIPTLACPVYCRYCFRRERVGHAANAPGPEDMSAAINYIRARQEIREAILTGGDPLSLSDRRLRDLLGALEGIPHLSNVRIHTRAPIASPDRVTDALIEAMQRKTTVWMVLHCNHPRELSVEVRAALTHLAGAGIPLLSQTVLLRGVNDDADVLEELMRAFVALRVKPYYLHHPDKAHGTARFRLPLAEGRAIAAALGDRLSGIARPTYVLDIPGGFGKVPILSERVRADGADWLVEDRTGRVHLYTDKGMP